jgi:hypothetical protein
MPTVTVLTIEFVESDIAPTELECSSLTNTSPSPES